MSQQTLYIREGDMEKWRALKKKSEFIHNALNPPDFKGIGEAAADLKEKLQTATFKRVESYGSQGAKLCKTHGTPLDGRGKCLQKGCKYS